MKDRASEYCCHDSNKPNQLNNNNNNNNSNDNNSNDDKMTSITTLYLPTMKWPVQKVANAHLSRASEVPRDADREPHDIAANQNGDLEVCEMMVELIIMSVYCTHNHR
jgi:hypothetical protein